MKGVCMFCKLEKELTQHEIIAQSYGGSTEDIKNILSTICRECHNNLEFYMNKNRGGAGAGKPVEPLKEFIIGSTKAKLITGSVYLDDSGMCYIDLGSPIYGMRAHHKLTGEEYIEAALSGGRAVWIAGSPGLNWVIYSAVKGV